MTDARTKPLSVPEFMIWHCANCGAAAEGKRKPCDCPTNVGTREGPNGKREQTWWESVTGLADKFRQEIGVYRLGPGDPKTDANTIFHIGKLALDNADAILSALRLAESHPSAIREAVEGEREACAKIADADREKCKARGSAVPSETHQDMWMACADTGRQIAVAIRARGEEKGNE